MARTLTWRRRTRRPWLLDAAALSLATTTLSLARFGYSVLLPGMKHDLDWSYTQAGLMNTSNALGYLVGAVAAGVVVFRLGEHRTFVFSFVVCAASILASGLTADYAILLALRASAGGSAALLFVSGATLAARLAQASPSSGLVLGVYFAGVGPGIVASALLAPIVLSMEGGWRVGWVAMGVIALVCAIPATRIGRLFEGSPAQRPSESSIGLRSLGWSLLAFTLYGLGYVSFMTFIVASYRDVGASVAGVTVFWSLLGAAAIGSAWAWGWLLEREGRSPLAVLLGLCTIGASLPLLGSSEPLMLGSALIFGGSFLGVVSAMTQLVRRTLPEYGWASGLATATALFAAGQAGGPYMTGFLADQTGDLAVGLALSAGFLALATFVATRQRPSVIGSIHDQFGAR